MFLVIRSTGSWDNAMETPIAAFDTEASARGWFKNISIALEQLGFEHDEDQTRKEKHPSWLGRWLSNAEKYVSIDEVRERLKGLDDGFIVFDEYVSYYLVEVPYRPIRPEHSDH